MAVWRNQPQQQQHRRCLTTISVTRNQEPNLNKKEEEKTKETHETQERTDEKKTDKQQPKERKFAPAAHSKLHQLVAAKNEKEALTFAKMLRHSKFVALGDQKNCYFYGKIIEVVGDDLYIDYGGKFNLICKRPPEKAE